MRPIILASTIVLVLSGATALAAVTPSPKLAPPQLFAPPQLPAEEDSTCLGVRVENLPTDAEILLRNECALRINFALCVRRTNETQVQISTGSLAPAAVHGELIRLDDRSSTFTHKANFCSGVMCKVTTPAC